MPRGKRSWTMERGAGLRASPWTAAPSTSPSSVAAARCAARASRWSVSLQITSNPSCACCRIPNARARSPWRHAPRRAHHVWWEWWLSRPRCLRGLDEAFAAAPLELVEQDAAELGKFVVAVVGQGFEDAVALGEVPAFSDHRARRVSLCFMLTGLRRSELMALRWGTSTPSSERSAWSSRSLMRASG